MRPNRGRCPPEATGKRVRVVLANGARGSEDRNPMSPRGWAADGRAGCRWTLLGLPHDIASYEVLA